MKHRRPVDGVRFVRLLSNTEEGLKNLIESNKEVYNIVKIEPVKLTGGYAAVLTVREY